MKLWDARCRKHGKFVRFYGTKLLHLDCLMKTSNDVCDSDTHFRYGIEYDRLELYVVSTLDDVMSIVDLGLSWSAA